MLRAEAAKKIRECRNAVPVWVRPLSRVVENFDPRSARFDVVIIDEASQSDVMALVHTRSVRLRLGIAPENSCFFNGCHPFCRLFRIQ